MVRVPPAAPPPLSVRARVLIVAACSFYLRLCGPFLRAHEPAPSGTDFVPDVAWLLCAADITRLERVKPTQLLIRVNAGPGAAGACAASPPAPRLRRSRAAAQPRWCLR